MFQKLTGLKGGLMGGKNDLGKRACLATMKRDEQSHDVGRIEKA